MRSDTSFGSLINAFAYWQGQEIGNATATFFDDIQQATARVQQIKGSINGVEIMVGETGKGNRCFSLQLIYELGETDVVPIKGGPLTEALTVRLSPLLRTPRLSGSGVFAA